MLISCFVTKMRAVADERGLEVEIWGEPLDKIKNEIENADILLLGPQVRYALEDLKPLCEQNNIPLEVINMIDYGMMNGAKILDQALDLI